jgi:hypothetical protein
MNQNEGALFFHKNFYLGEHPQLFIYFYDGPNQNGSLPPQNK